MLFNVRVIKVHREESFVACEARSSQDAKRKVMEIAERGDKMIYTKMPVEFQTEIVTTSAT